MKQLRTKWRALTLVLAFGLTAVACDDDDPAGPGGGDTDPDHVALSGNIADGETRILSADSTWLLQGIVTVDSGGVLEIEPGTLILGDVNVRPTALVVRRGGRILAEGTAQAPIVFTSSAPVGSRARGQWGGVVLNGYSYCNFPAGECIGEGSSGEYGGNDPDDSSGVLAYVRIEFAGHEVSFGNELNGLTLNGVGRGTELHHIQVHMGSDDGIEFFGGTADLRYALITGASDDSYDYSTGWQGRGQFWIAQQDPDDADAGFEVDNNEFTYDAEPLTSPTIYNVTLIGKGASGSAGESTRGLLLRRGTAGRIRNAIVMGFGAAGLDIDNDETYAHCTAGTLVVAHSIFFDNTAFLDTDADDETACTSTQIGLIEADPLLAAPYDRNAPDFRPGAGSPALSGYAAPPDDGFFMAVDYIGAVDRDGTPWYAGWTTTAVN